MRNIIRKGAYVGGLLLVFSGILSCEKDFTNIGTSIINNSKFSTGEIVLDLEISPINLENIVVDNIGLPTLRTNGKPVVDYWLGVYKNTNAKKVEAGFVSQLKLPSNLKNSEKVKDGDTIYNLDKVVLKIPYTAVSLGKNTQGITTYRLDSILGNTSVSTPVNVYINPTFLNTLNPSNPAKQNSYLSNFDYKETEQLTEASDFSFKPLATDTIFLFDRIDRSLDVNSTTIVKDTLKVYSSKIPVPFLAIPLDLNKMKTLFWDKFNNSEFYSSLEFQRYFKGIILKSKGDDGALVPFNLSASSQSSIDFLYSKTILKEKVVDKVIKESYSFSLSGVQNNIYKKEDLSSAPMNSFIIQGTSGSSAKIKVLGVNLSNLDPNDPFLLAYANKDVDNNNYLDLKELASIRNPKNNSFGFLINDADLTFMVNKDLSSNSDVLPQRLYVYQNKDNGKGGVTPTHLSDSYKESTTYGGTLLIEEKIPKSYTFKITDYISDLIDGTSKDYFSPLILKVFNSTDNPLITGTLNENVLQYNWNPRSVVLFDENGDNKAQLKISYSEKKN